MRPRPKRRPRALGDVVPQVLEELGLEGANTLRDLAKAWEDALVRVVGAEAAGHSRPSALRGRVLEVSADSSAWCHHLQLQRERMLAELARQLGGEAPADLRFRVG